MGGEPEDGRPADPLDRGWQDLADGRWADARSSFELANARTPSAEAAEGLSWAAWWLDDADTVFASRAAAYRAYRARGDLAGAARMATWIAADELDFHGGIAVASGWLRRADRLLGSVEVGPEHGWLAFHRGYLAHLSGDGELAAAQASTAAELGRRFEVPDLEMLGLALEGAALVSGARMAEGMGLLDEATATALEGNATIPISGAWACCFLITACSAVHDLDRAAAWCDRIADFAERYGSRYMLAFCRAEYGQIHLWRGDWSAAEVVLSAARGDFASSRPAWSAAPTATLAELRRRQGRLDEAMELFTSAGATEAAQLGRARVALDRGSPRRAVDLLERLLRRIPEDRRLERLPVVELLGRARLALGSLEEAAAVVPVLRGAARELGTVATRAVADLLEGSIAAARGDHARARSLLEDAVDAYERAGAPYEAACARTELSTELLALGDPAAAELELRPALDALRALGAERAAERAERLLAAIERDARVPAHVTRREREVLCLVAEGLTNRQIAERLFLSEHTVHRHVTNILRKLDLPSRTAAAAHALRAGLLDHPVG